MAVRERRKLAISFFICGALALVAVSGAVFWVIETQATGTEATLIVLIAAIIPVILIGWLWLRIDNRFLQPLVHLTRELETIIHADPNRSVKDFDPGSLEKLTHSISEIVERSDRTKREVSSAIVATTTHLEAEKSQLAAVLGNLAVGVILCTRDDTILMWNEAARRVVGDALALGRKITEIFDESVLKAVFSEVKEAGRPVCVNLENYGSVCVDKLPEGTFAGHVFCFEAQTEERLPSRPMVYDFEILNRRQTTGNLGKQRIDELEYVVFDTETTGMRPNAGDAIVQIGAVKVSHGRVIDADNFDTLVNPGRKIPPSSTRFHGITDDMVKEAPDVSTALKRFHLYLGDSILVAQNAAFDMQFLKAAEETVGVHFDHLLIDTMLASFCLHPNESEHTLNHVAKRYGVDIGGRHTALGDAFVTARILCKMIPLLIADGIETLDDLIERTTEVGRRNFGQ